MGAALYFFCAFVLFFFMEGELVIWVWDVAWWRFVAELHLELIGERREDLVLALSDLLNHIVILIDVLDLDNRVWDIRIDLVSELFSQVENLALQDLGLVNLVLARLFLASESESLSLHHLSFCLLLVGLLRDEVFNLVADLVTFLLELRLLV